MKLARFEHKGQVRIGLVDAEQGRLSQLALPDAHDAMIALIEACLAGHAPTLVGDTFALDVVRLLPPIVAPRKNILCIGENYAAHAREFAESGFDASARDDTSVIPEAPLCLARRRAR